MLIIGAGALSTDSVVLAVAGWVPLGLSMGMWWICQSQRQVIHFTEDIGRPKVESAAQKMRAINPDIKVIPYYDLVMASNVLDLIKDYDFVIDGTDNFSAKFLINDACVMAKKPYSHGGILRFDGQTMTYVPGHTCYRCVFTAPPPKGLVPTCSQAGVLGAVAGMLGTVQATETLKFLCGTGELLTDRLFIFNAATMNVRTAKLNRNPHCPICGDHPTIHELIDGEQAVCDIR